MADKLKGFRDEKKPGHLVVSIKDEQGKEWGSYIAVQKDFSTGSVGFNISEKVTNPDNPQAKYQLGLNLTLIGSKP